MAATANALVNTSMENVMPEFCFAKMNNASRNSASMAVVLT